MIIFPMHTKDSNDRVYQSGAVWTSDPRGGRKLVGVSYDAGSVDEIIRLAVLNAKVAQMRMALRDNLAVRRVHQPMNSTV